MAQTPGCFKLGSSRARPGRRIDVGSKTINDVAKHAGVSKKTVSRILNSEPHVSAALRERVLNAVKELRYRPRTSARSMRGGRSYVLGFLLTGPYPYAIEGQLGALTACRRAGYHLLVEAMDPAGTDLDEGLELLTGGLPVDGVILLPPLCDNQALMSGLDTAGIPYARIAPATDRQRTPYVDPDDLRAAHVMTEHLLELGHTRIGFIKGPAGHLASTLRLDGYRQALKDWGLAAEEELILDGRFTFESGYDAAGPLLHLADPPTAVFASNDLMALGVMARAQELGLRLPQALSVAGFDDIPSAAMTRPDLTTMRQPIARMTEIATEMLIGRAPGVEGGARPLHRTLGCELVIRRSTAPPSRPGKTAARRNGTSTRTGR